MDKRGQQQPRRYVVFTGSRTWADRKIVAHVLDRHLCPVHDTIVHGACKSGLDAIVDRLARERHFAVRRMPAQWKQYGRSAGPKRNQAMLELYRPRCVYAFVKRDPNTGKITAGTADCIRRAKALGIRVNKFERMNK